MDGGDIFFFEGAAGDEDEFSYEVGMLRGENETEPCAPGKTDEGERRGGIFFEECAEFFDLAIERGGGLERFEDAAGRGEFAGDRSHFAGGAGAAVDDGDVEGRVAVGAEVLHGWNFLSRMTGVGTRATVLRLGCEKTAMQPDAREGMMRVGACQEKLRAEGR